VSQIILRDSDFDRYARLWPTERFRAHDIAYEPAEKPKSDLYRDMLPLLNARRIELLDDRKLITAIRATIGQNENCWYCLRHLDKRRPKVLLCS
jgi:hypothetical protein